MRKRRRAERARESAEAEELAWYGMIYEARIGLARRQRTRLYAWESEHLTGDSDFATTDWPEWELILGRSAPESLRRGQRVAHWPGHRASPTPPRAPVQASSSSSRERSAKRSPRAALTLLWNRACSWLGRGLVTSHERLTTSARRRCG